MTVNLQVLLKINVLHNVQKNSLGVDHTEDILGQYLHMLINIAQLFNQSKWRETPINGTSAIVKYKDTMVFSIEKNIQRTKVNILRGDEEEYWEGTEEYSEGRRKGIFGGQCFYKVFSPDRLQIG